LVQRIDRIAPSASRPAHHLLIELVDRHDLVDQPDKLGLRGGHQVAGEQILFGARKADEL
jgi:hypothetical protein